MHEILHFTNSPCGLTYCHFMQATHLPCTGFAFFPYLSIGVVWLCHLVLPMLPSTPNSRTHHIYLLSASFSWFQKPPVKSGIAMLQVRHHEVGKKRKSGLFWGYSCTYWAVKQLTNWKSWLSVHYACVLCCVNTLNQICHQWDVLCHVLRYSWHKHKDC